MTIKKIRNLLLLASFILVFSIVGAPIASAKSNDSFNKEYKQRVDQFEGIFEFIDEEAGLEKEQNDSGFFINFDGEKEQLSSEVLSDDFDLAEAVDSLSIQEMDAKEKKLFDQIVEERVNLQGLKGEDAEKQKNAITSYFDSSSEDKNKLFNTQKDFYDDTQNIVRPQLIAIGVNFGGTLLNVAIGAAVGGGVGAIQAFIAKKGKKEAERIFTKTVVTKLKAWGLKSLATFVGTAVAVALEYSDIGTRIMMYLDSIDSKPNNGWVNIL